MKGQITALQREGKLGGDGKGGASGNYRGARDKNAAESARARDPICCWLASVEDMREMTTKKKPIRYTCVVETLAYHVRSAWNQANPSTHEWPQLRWPFPVRMYRLASSAPSLAYGI